MRLQAKIVLWIALILAVFLGASYSVTTYLSVASLNHEFEEATRRKAMVLMETIYNNVVSASEPNHLQRLEDILHVTNAYTELEQLVIFARDSREILWSLDPGDIDRKISDTHYQVFLKDQIRGRAYDVGTSREFCLVRPLRNEERCQRCHEPTQSILGVLDVCLSMRDAKERMNRNRDIMRTAGVAGALATIIATSVALGLLISLLVNRPVSSMVRVIRQVEEGNLNARVEHPTHDELGVMGRSFNSMIETIRKLNEMKDDFISIVSHELRTPLTSIKYFAEVMMERVGQIEPARQQKYLRVINEETDRLTRLINDLLDLQKISAGKFKWKHEEIDVREVVRSTVGTFSGAAAARNVQIVARVDPGLPKVMGDHDKVVQLIANLLSNAIKFTRSGSTVTVSAERGEDAARISQKRFSRYVKVAVTDEGIGISAENLEKIFEKFQQVEDHVTRSQGGTGLGLSICREIVLHHGGTIWAESELGTGSTFSFTLPYEEQPVSAADPAGAPPA